MTRNDLFDQISLKRTCLCIGLDTDITRIPSYLLSYKDPVFEFNKMIIDATKNHCIAYKPNLAFYESQGSKGWASLEKTMEYIPKDIFTIADAKRGDIGNTSKMYAKSFFEHFNFDAVTVAPYMGEDSVAPFLEFEDKWVILLGLTSNKGSYDFQHLKTEDGFLYESVIKKAQKWGNPNNLMFVVGATHPDKMSTIRNLAKEYFFLVPGIGAQGGNLEEIMQNGHNDKGGLIINSSREIIYAGSGEEFAISASSKAKMLNSTISKFL